MNSTLQDRLVKELREAGIPHTRNIDEALAEANVFLRDIFLPQFNHQFMVIPKSDVDIHTPLTDTEILQRDSIFAEQKTRKIQNDFTVRFEGKILQIYRNKAGGSLVYHGDLVTIEKRLNGDIHLYNKSGNSLIF